MRNQVVEDFVCEDQDFFLLYFVLVLDVFCGEGALPITMIFMTERG